MTAPKPSAQTLDQHSASLFSELVSVCGIQDRFINFSGTTEVINQQELSAILHAQGIDVSSAFSPVDADMINKQLTGLQSAQHTRLLPPVVVFTVHSGTTGYEICLNIPEHYLTGVVRWCSISERGVCSDMVTVPIDSLLENSRHRVDDTLFVKKKLPLELSCLQPGYHKLTVTLQAALTSSDTVTGTIPLILAPPRCFEPEWSAAGRKLWGFSVQLYSFCTERSWGIGDFFDLGTLIRTSAGAGANYLILNPLHAGPLHQPDQCSPYSPVDRRRLNPLYIAPELEAEFSECAAEDWLSTHKTAINLLTKIRQSEWVDYDGVAELKIHVLAMMYEHFITGAGNSPRRLAFDAFRNNNQSGLDDYAQWQARHGCTAAGRFSNTPDFYIYLQWLAEMQLAACQRQALDLGMTVGLIRDLAVGSDREGAEVSLSEGVFSTEASIGAPPDPLAPQGQNWGLPPMNPVKLREQGYAAFISLLRSNMEHSGALRIDHVMSLMRLWWCPYEKSGQGAYVLYPADDLFAILRLESQRQQCLVIGEDLGIVPAEVRRHLNESGIYSNLLFYFEKEGADQFRSPQQYTQRSLAMLANHDVPALAAWWSGSDLTLRHTLGLIADDASLTEQKHYRQSEKKQVLQLLESQWLLPADRFGPDQLEKEMDIMLAAAIMRCISRSSAMLVSVQLEDLLLIKLPVNIPGTSSEYKNWRRKMPCTLINMMDQELIKPMLESLRVERH